MEKIEYSGIELLVLYLRKLEQLTDGERRVITKSIELINTPIFVTNSPL